MPPSASVLQTICSLGESGPPGFFAWVFQNTKPRNEWERSIYKPGPLSGIKPSAYWSQLSDPWYIAIDILYYAPELAPVTIPILQRLDDLLDKGFSEEKERLPNQNLLAIKAGVMAYVAEFGFASSPRQAEISDLLTEAAKVLYQTDDFDVKLGGGIVYRGPAIRPAFSGFSSDQELVLNNLLDWLTAKYPKLLPWRLITIVAMPKNQDVSGGTSPWDGNIYLDTGLFSQTTSDASLIQTISHELLHAKPERLLDRCYSWLRTKGGIKLPFTSLRIGAGVTIDESEEDFITLAGLAVRAAYVGDDGESAKHLEFNPQGDWPQICSKTGEVLASLPMWSSVLAQFIAENIVMDQIQKGVWKPGWVVIPGESP